MAVVKNGDWWYYEWKLGGRTIRRTSGFRISETSREHVRTLEDSAKAKVEAELMEKGLVKIKPGRIRFSEASKRMYSEVWSRKRNSEAPLRNCEIIQELIGDKYLDSITVDDIAHLKTRLFARGISGSTVNRYLAALSAVLNRAHRYWEVLDRVPRIPKEDESGNERVRVVTWEEEARILEGCEKLKEHDFADLYIILVDTGMRLGESLSMTYGRDISLRDNVITIQARNHKNNKAKGIPLTKRAREVLDRRKELGNVAPFSNFHKYAPLYRLQKVLRAAGLPPKGDIVIHSLRHTFASRLANEGVPIYEVSKLLGHSSVTTTERIYAHLFIDRLRTSIGVLDNAIDAVQNDQRKEAK